MKLILFAVFSAAVFYKGYSQSVDPALAAKLQTRLDSLQTLYAIEGISASVIYPAQGQWLGVSGESHAGVPVTPDMEFGIGSNTKLFTAVTLLNLVENNLLTLNDSLHEWLPVYPNVDPDITIRQLLNHVSGLEDINQVVGFDDSINTDPTHIFTPEELMTWVGPPLFAPGTDWSYSNTNYIIAAMIIESASGINFGQILRDSVLTPLGLDSTFLDVEETVTGTIAHPWHSGIDIAATPRISLNSATWSAGGMYSTAGEMAQWYYAVMNNQIVSPALFDELILFTGSGNYGFGISEQVMGGETVWGHGGNVPGYLSNVIYHPASGIIVSVLTNDNPCPVSIIVQELLLAVLEYSTAGIPENGLGELVVYPNPAHEIITVKGVKATDFNLMIYDVSGNLVLESNTQQTDISLLKAGVYVMHIQSTEALYTKRLVIEN
ncbi:MAG: serine hydrolase [Bacteroidetes bacterium]|nr:serine hydrolase [Bacteroidota bacterium]